ncbi:MAG: hypothetical protein JWL95_671 [Gemmatimonadetes bacterium]|nr:hypothetical protein [Gemmatimonadota bacterium]
MPAHLLAGARARGGILGYPLDDLHEEVAFVAYHFHWPQGEIMAMEHEERRGWVEQISTINGKVNGER